MRIGKGRLGFEPNAVAALLVNVQIKRNAIFSQCFGEQKGVFQRHGLVFKGGPQKHGGVLVVTCSSLESSFTSSGAGVFPSRLFFEPWWVNSPSEITA